MTPATLTYDERPLASMPEGLDFSRGETNRILLRAAWKVAGLLPTYPIDTRGVLALLKICGFDANRQKLDYCLKRRYFSAPKKRGNDYQWNESNIIDFADTLEGMRKWLPNHPVHRHKLNSDERSTHEVESGKMSAALEAFSNLSIAELISRMVEAQRERTRELLGAALSARIGVVHLKGNEKVPDHAPQEVN